MRLVVVGGSDAGISAALRARELEPSTDVEVVLADEHPNLSICGLPYYVSGEVSTWQSLAHRTREDLHATGMRLRTSTRALEVDVAGRQVVVRRPDGTVEHLGYDELVVGTGAVPVRPPLQGLDGLGPADGVHVLHTMDDALTLTADLDARQVRSAAVVGAGYIGLEMVEALVARGLEVTLLSRPPEVLATLDPPLGALVRAEVERHGVHVLTGTTATGLTPLPGGRLRLDAAGPGGPLHRDVDLVLVVAGVRPDVDLLVRAGARTGAGGAVVVDPSMATGLPHVRAAGDCVVTHHQLLGRTWLPLGTTAHKQGRVAGAAAAGHHATFAGSLGTQVVKVFDLVAARTGLLDHEARAVGRAPLTTQVRADDHKAYYPGAQPLHVRLTGDVDDGRLLGAQLVGRLGSEVARRVDVVAAALAAGTTVAGVLDLDLSYTPPLGSPWDAVQSAAQAWEGQVRPARTPVRA